MELGGSAPRIMSIDDYFMVESETKGKSPVYEYEKEMEETYTQYLIKSFKKTVSDGLFPFIIVDCVNESLRSFDDIYNYAKGNGFVPYICDMERNLEKCLENNIHSRSEADIKRIFNNWHETPEDYSTLDPRSLLQSSTIPEVNMEDVLSEEVCFFILNLTFFN